MRLSSRKFNVEDFKDAQVQSWISTLLQPLNIFMQEIYAGMQNQVTMENLSQEVRSFSFTNNAGEFPIQIKTKINQYPQGVTVLYCKTDQDLGPSSTPWLDWTFSSQTLNISSISNLTSGLNYTLRILIIYS